MLSETIQINGKEIRLETGRVARQANGAVLAREGDTVVLVTAVHEKPQRTGLDFFPMTVEYRERTAAAGRVPGGFFKREMRPADRETLTSRLVDRCLRPLFPKAFQNETQIIATVLSFDPDADPGVLAITGASLAAHISDMPWNGPVAGIRVAQVDGQLVANPNFEEKERAALDLIVAVSKDGLVMVEGTCEEVPEATVVEALEFARKAAQPLIAAMERMREKAGKPKIELEEPPEEDPKWVEEICEAARPELQGILRAAMDKLSLQKAIQGLRDQIAERFAGEAEDAAEKTKKIRSIFEDLESREVRGLLVQEGLRVDGRGPKDIRPISGTVGWLPRTHGSALFTRGETQAMVSCTLGTGQDEQIVEALHGEAREHFLLHYNFPPYSVGEVRRIMGPGRREIGHGNLARRALDSIIPDHDVFPYTIRIVSDISESNGSSSMATVCGGTLAMMDAGVPIPAPVAGIAMGLIQEGDQIIVLSDILGTEDHLGDMDFKLAGTRRGITAVQLDNKLGEVKPEVLTEALEQARQGRNHILDEMLKILEAPREDISQYAPQVHVVSIRRERIRDLIGPQGRVIQQIQGQTGTNIEVNDEGMVRVYSPGKAALEEALRMIKYYTADLEKGKIYKGTVVSVKDFGAFVRIYGNMEGLVHISELDNYRVNKVSDVLKEGEETIVKVIDVDRQGKIKLSRKDALDIPASEIEG
jgi:polyribonucleotide nucleotidyltransferase